MQNRYVGDLGDFGKYGLLRALCVPGDALGGPELSLGIVWYLVPDETRTGDGNFSGTWSPQPGIRQFTGLATYPFTMRCRRLSWGRNGT